MPDKARSNNSYHSALARAKLMRHFTESCMPELPEVQTVVTTLRDAVIGRKFTRIQLNRTDIVHPPGNDLPRQLANRTIAELTRRGKRILFTLDDDTQFYIHLGMSGQLRLEREDTPLRPHTHALFFLNKVTREDHPQQIRFRDPRRFGGIFLLSSGQGPDTGLGPEPLTMRAKQFHVSLSRAHRPVKSALLDQRLIAGLGNIYVDESLFRSGIHPLRHAADLSLAETKRLLESIKHTLRRAIKHRGSTLRDYTDSTGRPGSFQLKHQVYHRATSPCVKCKTPIERITVTGRSTHFCPRCQLQSGRIKQLVGR